MQKQWFIEFLIEYISAENEEFRTCIIKGSAQATQMAEALIQKIIWNQPIIEIVEMWIPSVSTGSHSKQFFKQTAVQY